MYYFGYGSNINHREMSCSDHTYIGFGFLTGYKLAFTRYSSKRRGGVLDIVKDKESKVIGAIYQIGENCIDFLDRKEGISWNYYRRLMIEAELNGEIISNVLCYEVVHKDETVLPSKEYSRIVLEGMIEKKFPNGYINDFRKLSNLLE